MKSRIKKAELELERILSLKLELDRYEDCSWKNALLKSCELCEEVWKRELNLLRNTGAPKPKKKVAKRKPNDDLSRGELEKIAFDANTPDDIASLALNDLMSLDAA